MNDLKNLCYVNTNENENRFVGIKIENGKPIVYFPLGYNLSNNDKLIRKDIRSLINILMIFTDKETKILSESTFSTSHPVEFPIFAYMDVLDFYIENGGNYYKVTETKYKSDTKGKIDWKKTIEKEKAFIKNDYPIYTNFQVKYQNPLENELITLIHKFCVYQAFQQLGWLYTYQIIPNPGIRLNKKIFSYELRNRYVNSQKDRDKRLFKSMLSMIEFIDDRISQNSLYFGTDRFEYVWEKLIDKVFGIPNKADYFPRATWIERTNSVPKRTSALIPDSIMIYDGNIYILDAKYYRYGTTHNPNHLPDSSSINKQITYGEYIEKQKKDPKSLVYNAFLIPFNKEQNNFETITCENIGDICRNIEQFMFNVAEAYGDWHNYSQTYERIQGIVVDMRKLMFNYLGDHEKDKKMLAEVIRKYLDN